MLLEEENWQGRTKAPTSMKISQPASIPERKKGVWWARVFPVQDLVLGSEANLLEIQIIRPEDK